MLLVNHQANLAVQEQRLGRANSDLAEAQGQLDAKQAELDEAQAEYDAAMKLKQVRQSPLDRMVETTWGCFTKILS